MFYAHTPSKHDPDTWHSFNEHTQSVANNCLRLGAKINMPKTAYTLGILHDLGKLKPEFQTKLTDAYYKNIDSSVAHKEVGAFMVKDVYGGALILPLLGHHYQIPSRNHVVDHYEKTNAQEIAYCSNLLSELLPDFKINCEDFINNKFKKPIDVFLALKMLNSVLVDSDHKDTSDFYSSYKAKPISIDINSLETIFNKYYGEFKSSDTEINKQRYQLYKDCLEAAETSDSFYVLPAPTGAGKTLSSLAFSLKKATLFNKERIIFALPYTSIIEQTANIYQNIFEEVKNSVLEHHSAVIDEDNVNNFWRSKTSENWDCPIVVTTVVQLFESLFSNKPSRNKKLHNMTNSVIILDEAQLLPLIYIKPIMEMLKSLADNYNCTVVICTATPPFLNNGKSWSLPNSPYCVVKNVNKMFSVFKRVNFFYDRDKISLDALVSTLSAQDSILCIVNKRKTAQIIASKIDKDYVYHLSTTMFPKHRSEIIQVIKNRIKDNLPVILIATSCVECGVDFDFPAVYRELAPLPSIIQAAGRCNRNGNLSSGNVVVFQIEKECVFDPVMRTGIAITKNILDKNILDLESIENSETYFKELFDINENDLDKKNILSEIKCLNFENVNDKFKIIEQNTISIVIPTPESMKIIDLIKDGGIVGININRKLSPYTISIYDTDVSNFSVDSNTVPNINIWTGNYNKVYGIELDVDK
jgi:CRISPR-associated endonuclease/helicase Cas3